MQKEEEADLVETRIPGGLQTSPMFKMYRSHSEKTSYTLQSQQWSFTMASQEKSEVPAAAAITEVDQDMVEWFKQLFNSYGSSGPHYTPTAVPVPPADVNPRNYSLQDIDHKSLYLQDKNLVAAPLQGDNSAQEEILSVLPNKFLDREKFPLILGVKGGSQCISCGKGDQPQLQLEDANLSHLFDNQEEAQRFTFFKSLKASTHRFESASYPGWYLCSPTEAHKPLTLAMLPAENIITDFYFQRK